MKTSHVLAANFLVPNPFSQLRRTRFAATSAVFVAIVAIGAAAQADIKAEF